ncbi:DUF2214 domain-containing protein [Paracoccus pacificus]|uniref:DUF2214 domain-containing protein n=1 Tax=Paracoccus pacificus TaxID=1463598 RepID=A0ABW4R802_9RHOB
MIELLAGWPGAELVRANPVAYLLLNASHILGIGLLLGAILPLDLRLAGLLSGPLGVLGPWLSRSAGLGLGLAILTGLWLFSVDPPEYLKNPAFRIKLLLIGAALANLAALHFSPGWKAARAGRRIAPAVRLMAALSALLWLSVLVAGRWIGFL